MCVCVCVCVCVSVLRIFLELGTIEKFYLIIVWMSSSEPEVESLEYWSASGLEDGMTLGEVSKSTSRSESYTLKTWSVSGWEDGITEKNGSIT